MKLELVSLSGIKYADEAYEVIIPTASGDIAVYQDHMPLISLAVPGALAIRKNKSDPDDKREFYAVLGGVIEVDGQTLRILVDEVDHADDIHEKDAEEAYAKAQKLKAEAKNQVELNQAQALMDRSAVRLKVAGLRRHKR